MITKEKKAELIEQYGRQPGDTGSPEVQIAILTERIRELTEHLKTHNSKNISNQSLSNQSIIYLHRLLVSSS